MKNIYIKPVVVLLLLTCISTAHALTVHVDQDREDPDYVPSVWVEKDGETVFEYEAGDPVILTKAELSPSGYYILIWTSEIVAAPTRFEIFRIADGKKPGEFGPFYSTASAKWVYGDKLIVLVSSGIGLVTLEVRDITGTKLHASSLTGYYLSEDGYFISYISSMAPSGKNTTDIRLYNINTHRWKILAESAEIGSVHVKADRGEAALRYRCMNGKKVVVDLPPSPFRRADSITSERVRFTEYTVKQGDTLWSIAEQHYGGGGKWQTIREINREKISEDGHIREGMVITVPVLD